MGCDLQRDHVVVDLHEDPVETRSGHDLVAHVQRLDQRVVTLELSLLRQDEHRPGHDEQHDDEDEGHGLAEGSWRRC